MLKYYLNLVLDTPLFDGLNHDESEGLLSCMNPAVKTFQKGSYVFLAGDAPEGIGIMLEGTALILKEDIFGNRSILSHLVKGDIFGEVFACAMVDELPITVEAESDCKVLIMDYQKVITTCSSSCEFHNMLIKNMLKILAQKNLALNAKNDILLSRTTRDKILKFLETVALEKNKSAFDIPFGRQELADFLGLNRSAMTREMQKMKDEGLIDFDKNHFELKE